LWDAILPFILPPPLALFESVDVVLEVLLQQSFVIFERRLRSGIDHVVKAINDERKMV
jgi:hypothetical protein